MKKIVFIFVIYLAMSNCFGGGPEIIPIIDLDNFTFLDEYPHSFEAIETMYSDLAFTEKRYDSYMKGVGQYAYAYRSDQISFYLYGDSREEALLYYLEIFSSNYENNKIRILGTKKEVIIRVLDESSYKYNINNDEIIIQSDNYLYFIGIEFEDDIVKSYSINKSL